MLDENSGSCESDLTAMVIWPKRLRRHVSRPVQWTPYTLAPQPCGGGRGTEKATEVLRGLQPCFLLNHFALCPCILQFTIWLFCLSSVGPLWTPFFEESCFLLLFVCFWMSGCDISSPSKTSGPCFSPWATCQTPNPQLTSGVGNVSPIQWLCLVIWIYPTLPTKNVSFYRYQPKASPSWFFFLIQTSNLECAYNSINIFARILEFIPHI